MAEDASDSNDIIAWTADIVASHVQNNSIEIEELPRLIRLVHDSLNGLSGEDSREKPKPAVSIRRSITPEFIICLEDGRKLKMLKRHLATAYRMSPEQYKEKWGLPKDYPMVAPNYAKHRSSLAKKIGLGRRRVENKR